jgi:hypothetical protein
MNVTTPPTPPRSPAVGDARVWQVIDEASAVADFSAKSALGALQRQAQEYGDDELGATVRVEGNILFAFGDGPAFERFQPHLATMVFAADMPYLRSRAAATKSLRARARYLHAIAAVSKRIDDGRAAADAYLDVIAAYRQQDWTDNAEAFHTLIDTFPLALVMSRRYGAADRLRAEAIAFLTDARPHFAHAKSGVLAGVVAEKKLFGRDELLQLRDVSLSLLQDVAGGTEQDIVALAEVGRRLADRIGEPALPWFRAEADALEWRIAHAGHPLLVETIGTRLLHVYARLADDEKRKDTVRRMREARGQQEYQSFSAQPDGWAEEVERLQTEARRLVRDQGPLSLLRLCATSPHLIPAVDEVREHLEQMERDGVGVWRKIASTVVTAGERTIAYDQSEFDEQYSIWWMFCSVGRFASLIGEAIASGDITLEHLARFFSASWIAREENISYGGDMRMPNDLMPLLIAPLKLYVNLGTNDVDGDLLIPALDSLVLRMEAVLRKLARLLGEVDTFTGSDGVTQVLGLRALLRNARITETLGADLTAFTIHTLMRDPEGLRDRIGHAILHHGQYRVLELDAVVLLLLRLAMLKVPTLDSHGDVGGT